MVFPIRAFFPGLACTKSCSNSCFFSRFAVHQIALQFVFFFPVCRASNRAPICAFFPVCRAPNRAPIRVFFPGLPCTKSCSNSCFFSRFGVHQVVLQFVFFFPVCRAPNRAPIRVFFPGFAVHQIVLQFVFFFPVCRAPKSCSNSCFFFPLGLPLPVWVL